MNKFLMRSFANTVACLGAAAALLCTSQGASAAYTNLTLIQEIDAGAVPGANYESGGTVSTQVILGATARVATNASWFGYKLGSNLQFDRPYVIEIQYPEDLPRAYLMLLVDCGGWGAGSHYAFHTGVYENKDKRFYTPENLTAYPLRKAYKSYWIIAWPQRHWSVEPRLQWFKSTHGDFDTGLWLYFANKDDDPNNNGLAVKSIKLYSVGGVEDLIDPQVDQLRVQAPRRTFWTLEGDSRNNGEAHVAKARIAGANTVVWTLMAWNWNFGPYAYGPDYVHATLRTILPAAMKHRMDVILKMEYGGSPDLPADGWMITPNNTGNDADLTRIGNHLSGACKSVNVRRACVLKDVQHLIDLVYREAGPNATVIKGFMLRNRRGYLAPSFADDDIDAYESETGNKVAGATYDEKRSTLKKELAWFSGKQTKTYDVGKHHQHPYMQWYYQKLGDFLGNIEGYLKSTYGSDKVLLYIPFSGEGINQNMPADKTKDLSRFLAGREWGYEPGVYRNRTFHYLLPADQPWNAGSSAYLNAMNTAAGSSILIDPMYIEYARAWFPYSGLAPSFEHGGQEWAQRSEILAVANANPIWLGKTDFCVIHRGFPDQWNDFLKHFYLIPNEAGTIFLDNPTVTVKTYSAGRVLVINKSLTPTTVDLGASYPTLYNKITGEAVSTKNIPLGACSMMMLGTQPGGLPNSDPAPSPVLIYQAEDAYRSAGSIEAAWPIKGDMYYKYPFGEPGAYLEFTVKVPAAGNYRLEFRYLLQNAGNLVAVNVNGQVISAGSDFPATENPKRFKIMPFANVALIAGANKIRLTALGNDAPGIDQLEVIQPTDGL